MKKIYLSAPGLICCAGRNKEELYESCLKGDRSGIVLRELPGQKMSFPAGQIKGELPQLDSQMPLNEPLVYGDNTRIIRIVNVAIEQIRTDIEKAIAKYGAQKVGVCLGSCDNGSEGTILSHQSLVDNGELPEDYNLQFQSASYPAQFIARKFGLQGPVMTITNACASGASAIARGADLIRSGYCDAVIAGGADVVSDTVLAGFHSLDALSDDLTNPFSRNRKGINLGEGAAFFLLTSEKSAEEDSIELLGFGESSDAYHMTAPIPDGTGPQKAIQLALSAAGLYPAQIGYVNLHGTGTEHNDNVEAIVMEKVFGNTPPPASSTKPITGHTLGAAGALETAICWMVLKEKKGLPVHCWDGEGEKELPFLSHVSNSECEVSRQISICMNNNFAFGGYNISLILGN